MRLLVFAVFDSKTAVFSQPFFDLTEGAARRWFTDNVNANEGPFVMWSKHPEDYSLFQIGFYETLSGEMEPLQPPVNLVTASAVKEYADGVVDRVKAWGSDPVLDLGSRNKK